MARARHRDVEKAALLLDLGGVAGRHVRRHAAVDDAQHRDRAPLLALGGMDRRQDQVVLVVAAGPGLVAGRRRRIERELGEEALARRIARGQPDQMGDVGGARRGVVVQALEQRHVPALDGGELARPGRRPARARRRTATRTPTTPARAPASARTRAAAPPDRRPRRARDQPAALAAPMPGTSCSARKPARWPRGLAAKRSTASTSLTCAASRNLQAAVLDERNVAPGQLELERVAVLGAAKEHRLALQRQPRLAQRQDALGDPRRLGRLVVDPDQRRPLGRAPIAPELLGMALRGQRDDGVRRRQQRRRRAVVLLEREHRRRRRERAAKSRMLRTSAARNE